MTERVTLAVVAVALTLLFLAMPAWRGVERARFESHPATLAEFDAKVAAMVTRDQIGEEDGVPVVRPAPGDVYLTAERWRFQPILELKAGQAYRLHVLSRDILHGAVIDGREALLAPGVEAVLPVTPTEPGRIALVCSEYCGLEHNKMRHWVTITP